MFRVYLLALVWFQSGVQGVVLKLGHARQSRGVGYTGPSVHFAREAVDGNPATYSCTQTTADSWLLLYFSVPSFPEWTKFSLKPTSMLSLSDHVVELYNGRRAVQTCSLSTENNTWSCRDPVVLATSIKISIKYGRVEIADIEVHGQTVQLNDLEYRAVCEDPEECENPPIDWDLECKGVEILLPPHTQSEHRITLIGSDLSPFGGLSWSNEKAYVTDKDNNVCSADDFLTVSSSLGSNMAGTAGTWSIMKNHTHIEMDYNLQIPYMVRYLYGECTKPFLGDVVDCIAFSTQLETAQYRAAVYDRSNTMGWGNNGWIADNNNTQFVPLNLERCGVVVRIPDSSKATSFSLSFYTDLDNPQRIGSITIEEKYVRLEGCPMYGYYTTHAQDIAGTWLIEKNQTHLEVCKDEILILSLDFADLGDGCSYRYYGNVVDGIRSLVSGYGSAYYREFRVPPAEEVTYRRYCPECPWEYLNLEEQGLEWTIDDASLLGKGSTHEVDLDLYDKDRIQVGTVTISYNTLSSYQWMRDNKVQVNLSTCPPVAGSGTFTGDLRGDWRLEKNATLFCVYKDGEVVFETRYQDCGFKLRNSLVRYVAFSEEVPYRRFKKNVAEKLIRPEPVVCESGYKVVTTAEASYLYCEACPRGSYGNGAGECVWCPKGTSTLNTASTSTRQCINADWIVCDKYNKGCWYNNPNETVSCDCSWDQYCEEGRCYYRPIKGGTPSNLPGTLLVFSAAALLHALAR